MLGCGRGDAESPAVRSVRYARLSGMPGCPVCPAVRRSGCPVCPAVRYVRRSGCPVCPAARYVRLPGCSTGLYGLRAAQRPASAAPLAGAIDRGARRHATAVYKTPRFGAAPAVSAASAVGRLHWPRGGGWAPTTHAGVGAAIPAGVPSPARRAPRNRRRPPNAAVEERPTLRRRDPAPTRQPWRHATRMAGPRWG